MSDNLMEFEGVIIDHAHDIFRVKVNDNHIVQAKLSGKMRLNKINLEVGDRVKVEVSPYDTTRGRVTFRLRTAKEAYRAASEKNDET